MKLWISLVLLVLGLAASALAEWRLEVPLATGSAHRFQYDGELSDEDLMNPECLRELRELATSDSESAAWIEGSLLSPFGRKRLVVECSNSPAEGVLWYGLYVEGQLVDQVEREDGGIEVVDGRARARLGAGIDPLLDREFRFECLHVDGLAFTRVKGPPPLLQAWSSLGSLEFLRQR